MPGSATSGEAANDRRFLGLVSVTPEFHVYAYDSAEHTEPLANCGVQV